MTTVSATEFSERALELLKNVESGDTVVVLRNGTPIARLEPTNTNCDPEKNHALDETDEATTDIFSGGFHKFDRLEAGGMRWR